MFNLKRSSEENDYESVIFMSLKGESVNLLVNISDTYVTKAFRNDYAIYAVDKSQYVKLEKAGILSEDYYSHKKRSRQGGSKNNRFADIWVKEDISCC